MLIIFFLSKSNRFTLVLGGKKEKSPSAKMTLAVFKHSEGLDMIKSRLLQARNNIKNMCRIHNFTLYFSPASQGNDNEFCTRTNITLSLCKIKAIGI